LKCEICGVEVDLPFRCNYCEHYFCPTHRLPENHDCTETWRVKAVRSARTATSPLQLASAGGNILITPKPSTVRFSKKELEHLALGTSLVTLAGVSYFLGTPVSVGAVGILLASTLFMMGFILHELAHKYVAQGYGLWAEFRLNMTGLLLTAISIVSPIKFIAPGAVMIAGFADQNRMGKTAFAGPLVNVIIASALLIVLPALGTTDIYHAVVAGAAINAFLALFNLIPFAVFDGKKVYTWDKRYWAALVLISIALTVYTTLVLQPF
jgi:Zn-dependent protease